MPQMRSRRSASNQKGLGSSAEKKEKHNERVSDHNHPTRFLALVHSGARSLRFPRLISLWGCRLQFVVLGLCFPQFATQPFRSERGLGRAEGRTGCAGSREESESTRRVAWSSLAELWETALNSGVWSKASRTSASCCFSTASPCPTTWCSRAMTYCVDMMS